MVTALSADVAKGVGLRHDTRLAVVGVRQKGHTVLTDLGGHSVLVVVHELAVSTAGRRDRRQVTGRGVGQVPDATVRPGEAGDPAVAVGADHYPLAGLVGDAGQLREQHTRTVVGQRLAVTLAGPKFRSTFLDQQCPGQTSAMSRWTSSV